VTVKAELPIVFMKLSHCHTVKLLLVWFLIYLIMFMLHIWSPNNIW